MFLYNERKFIESLHPHDADAYEYFPDVIVQYLENNNRLHTIQNRVYFKMFDIVLHNLKVLIRRARGRGDNMVQSAEIVAMHTDFTIFDYVTTLVEKIGFPYRFHIDLTILCTAGII